MLSIALAYVLFSIPLDGGDIVVQGGVYPQYQIERHFRLWEGYGSGGLSTPLGNVYAPGRFRVEEYRHLEQWIALGPWFAVSYLLTLGEPFEPYSIRDSSTGVDFSRMWVPDERRYHQWTVTFSGPDTTIEFMKGWLP